jgi:hypothetical protein
VGPAFRPERQINVFELGLCDGDGDLRFKVRGQFALAANRVENAHTPRLKLTQVSETLFELAELGVIKAAGGLLTRSRKPAMNCGVNSARGMSSMGVSKFIIRKYPARVDDAKSR